MLAVAVHLHKHFIAGPRGEPVSRLQCGSVTEIERVPGNGRPGAVGGPGRSIGRPVIDNQNVGLGYLPANRSYNAANASLFVIGGDNDERSQPFPRINQDIQGS